MTESCSRSSSLEALNSILPTGTIFRPYAFELGITNLTQEAKDLITKCLVVDPAKRITAQQALKHAWFTVRSSLGSMTHSE